MIVAGMKNGEMREGPFSSRILCSRSITSNPPMPLPIYTPVRSASSSLVDLEARSLEREFARRDGELNEAPHLLDFFFLDVERRVEVLHLARDAAIEAGGVEGGDGRDPVLALLDGFPDRFRADANRSQHADSSDYNSA